MIDARIAGLTKFVFARLRTVNDIDGFFRISHNHFGQIDVCPDFDEPAVQLRRPYLPATQPGLPLNRPNRLIT